MNLLLPRALCGRVEESDIPSHGGAEAGIPEGDADGSRTTGFPGKFRELENCIESHGWILAACLHCSQRHLGHRNHFLFSKLAIFCHGSHSLIFPHQTLPGLHNLITEEEVTRSWCIYSRIMIDMDLIDLGNGMYHSVQKLLFKEM